MSYDAEVTGRRYGKSAQLDEHKPEILADPAVAHRMYGHQGRLSVRGVKSAKPGDRLRRRAAMRMRRAGSGASSRSGQVMVDGEKRAVPECPHVEVRWLEVPHPRYGNAQPFFVSYHAAVGQHVCVGVR